MSKILIISSGLKHAQVFVEPFIKRLEIYLSSKSECVDVRNTSTFDERTFFEYDQVIFVFSVALDSIPSSTLEIFSKLEGQQTKHPEIYALIACDEYEPEKCNLSEKIMTKWCEREKLRFMGSLKVGSVLFIMKTSSKFIVSNYIKSFAEAILKRRKIHAKVSVLSEKSFLKHANRYWNKEIRKKHNEQTKDTKD